MPAIAAALLVFSSVQADPRLAGSLRKDVAGWMYVRLAGRPREIGYQYGTLLAAEIDDAHQALRSEVKGPNGEGWEWYRTAAKNLFWGKVDPEYQQEIEGQAEALQAKGFKYDAWDVLAYNAHIELEG